MLICSTLDMPEPAASTLPHEVRRGSIAQTCACAGRAVSAAAAIMRAIAEGGTAAAAPMREAALTQGALLHHLHTAVLSQVMSSFSRGYEL